MPSRMLKLRLSSANDGEMSLRSSIITVTGMDILRGLSDMSMAKMLSWYMLISSLSNETRETSLPVVTIGGWA